MFGKNEKDEAETKSVDHGDELAITEQDREAAEGDQTPLQMRNVDEDNLIPDEGETYVASGIDPAHVQTPETEENTPKGTLPGV